MEEEKLEGNTIYLKPADWAKLDAVALSHEGNRNSVVAASLELLEANKDNPVPVVAEYFRIAAAKEALRQQGLKLDLFAKKQEEKKQQKKAEEKANAIEHEFSISRQRAESNARNSLQSVQHLKKGTPEFDDALAEKMQEWEEGRKRNAEKVLKNQEFLKNDTEKRKAAIEAEINKPNEGLK